MGRDAKVQTNKTGTAKKDNKKKAIIEVQNNYLLGSRYEALRINKK